MSWIASSHHVLSVKHLHSQFRNILGVVGRGAFSRKWRKTRHEEMETRKRNHVNSQFTKVSVELAWEAKTSCHSRHGYRN
uniref:Uncharacterized protein n=1 Tax=Meloidogyne incognita TaxID=6306 RepID=A0A914KL47_MELIC